MPFGLIKHGGHCCGVTHFYCAGFHTPDKLISRQPKWGYGTVAAGEVYTGYLSNRPADNPASASVYLPPIMGGYEFPEQTAGERLDAMISRYVKSIRSQGVIEIALTGIQNEGWAEFLKSRGFKHVGEAVNSNTMRTIHMWMLYCKGFDKLKKCLRDAITMTPNP